MNGCETDSLNDKETPILFGLSLDDFCTMVCVKMNNLVYWCIEGQIPDIWGLKRMSASLPHLTARLLRCSQYGNCGIFATTVVDGASLERVLSTDAYRRRYDYAKLICNVAEGVRDMLSAGIVHGDIKPPNIMVSATGEIKFVDFGFCRSVHKAAQLYIRGSTQLRTGSPFYVPPENEPDRTANPEKTFVWQIAMIMLRVLFGDQHMVPIWDETEQGLWGIPHFANRQQFDWARKRICNEQIRSRLMPLKTRTILTQLLVEVLQWEPEARLSLHLFIHCLQTYNQ